MLLGLSVALVVLIFDQASKYYMLNEVLSEKAVVIVAPFFNLVRAWNTGVSFSMFNSHGFAGVVALSLVALAIVGFLLHWLYQETNKLVQVSLGLIIGGALGNVMDRIRLGAVFDFLDFYVGESHWPAFNVADSCICVGAVLIIAHSLIAGKRKAG